MKINIVLFLIVINLFACQMNTAESNSLPPEDVLKVSGYQDINTYMEEGIDVLYAGKVLMTPSQLEVFLSENKLQDILHDDERPFFTTSLNDVSWWQPDKENRVRGGQYEENGWVREVLISENTGEIVVYYQVYSI